MTSRFVLKTAVEKEIERDASKILDSAREEGEELLREARSRRERMLREAAERLERDLAVRRHRTLAKTRLDGRNALLEVKRREVDRVFEEVRQILLAMPEEDPKRYGQILSVLFRAGRSVLPKGPLRVRAGENEEEALTRATRDEEVEIVVEKGRHGMVLETPDGRKRCDLSFEDLPRRIRAGREAELEKILFGGKK